MQFMFLNPCLRGILKYGNVIVITLYITFDKQAKHWTQEEIAQVLYLEHYIEWLRDMDTKKIGIESFEILMLEENWDKLLRESS